ncbi:hypothetical protein HYV31_01425 [candidate division WWE3 bacterium]|nr:hypothetical protein [candidate division WWE3 bacterium]
MLKLSSFMNIFEHEKTWSEFLQSLLLKLNPKYWISQINQAHEDYKDKKKRKELRRKIKRAFKHTFSLKTMQKIVIAFVSIALIASYVLPYIIR